MGFKIEYDTDEKPGYWVDANSVEIDQYTSIFYHKPIILMVYG